jgi:hypothetical protein
VKLFLSRAFFVVDDLVVFLMIADPEPDETILCLDSERPEVFIHASFETSTIN